jgi:hypothetical protein
LLAASECFHGWIGWRSDDRGDPHGLDVGGVAAVDGYALISSSSMEYSQMVCGASISTSRRAK